ncbi:MAG TPA: hypothetical protein VGD42_06045 [Lysobacter sp.]
MGATTTATDAVAYGSRTTAAGVNSTVLGNQVTATGDASIAIQGNSSSNVATDAASTNGIAIGTMSAVATSASGVAMGEAAKVTGAAKGVALGANASVTAANSVALGASSTTTADLTQPGYNPGASTLSGTASAANGEVSIGSSTKERRLTNLAAGSAATDAVNVSQLQSEDATVDLQGANTASALGGGASYNAMTGAISAPSYALTKANTIAGTSGAATDVGTGFDKVDAALGTMNTAVAQNTADIAGNTTSINAITTQLNNGTIGLVQQAAAGQNLTVGKDTDGAAVDFAGTAGARKLINVADGTVATGSKDAVNGGQLYTTNQAVAQNTTDIASLDSRVTVNEGDITTLQGDVTNLDGRVTTNEGNITNLQTTVNNLSSGTIGLVQQSAAGANLTVGKDTDGAAVDFTGTAGERKLVGVADGTVAAGSKEAVNGGQLYTTNQAVAQNTTDIASLDSRVTVNEGDITTLQGDVTNLDGRVTTTEGNITNLDSRVTTNEGDITTLQGDVTNLGGRVTTNEGNITNLQTTVNNLSSGTIGLVQQSAAGANLTVGKDTDGAAVDFAGTAGARKLLNVADGDVSAASKEAVNGSQLYTTNQAVAQNTSDIAGLDGRVTTNEGDISTLNTNVSNIDNRVTQNTTDISSLDSRVTVNEGDITTLQGDVTNLGGRVTTNEGNITSLQTTVNNLSSGTIGLVQQAVAGANLTVGKDTDGAAVDFAGTAGARKLLNVADGDVSVASKEAVNGSQLYATNQAVAQNTSDIAGLDGRVTTAEGNITSLDNRVTTNEGDISTLKTDVTNIDGRVTTVEGNITSLDNRVTTNENNISTLTTNVSNIDGRVTNVEGSVSNITNQLNSGEIGLVKYDSASGTVSVASDKAGTTVDFRNNGGVARRLKGVAAGGEDEDAVNVSQLKKVTDAMGGGAAVNSDGTVTGPTYYVTNADGSQSTVNNVGAAITNIDGRTYANTTAITNLSTQINSGTVGLVQQAAAGAKLTVGKDTDGTEVDFADKDGNARKLTNVADGTVAAGSKDAVNGGQLYGVSQSVASALGGGSVVNGDGTISAPSYTVTNADGSTSQVAGVEGAITNLDGRVHQNTQNIANNTTAITNLTTQISNGEVGLVKQDAATRQITVAKDTDGTSVSMAGTAGDRVVSGVASAKADNDAVNLGQLKAAGVVGVNGESKSVVSYDDAGKTSLTMGGQGATTAVTIHNVADGVADHDAVNISQLNQRLSQNTTEVLVQANDYTDQRVNDVWAGMDKVARQVIKQDRSISQHGAMSMAEAQMTSGAAAAAVGNPNGAWSVGLGYEQGYGAISAGYAKPVGKKSQISFGAAFSGDERSVGVGFAHKL